MFDHLQMMAMMIDKPESVVARTIREIPQKFAKTASIQNATIVKRTCCRLSINIHQGYTLV